MSKFGISAVRYDADHSRITFVRAYTFSAENSLGEINDYAREAVVKGIEDGHVFVTLVESSDKTDPAKKTFNIGPTVIVVQIGDEKFIKTVSNETEEDNLGELPEF